MYFKKFEIFFWKKKRFRLPFLYFLIFYQSYYLIFHIQKVATHSKERNKNRIMTIGKKTKKSYSVKECQKNSKYLI